VKVKVKEDLWFNLQIALKQTINGKIEYYSYSIKFPQFCLGISPVSGTSESLICAILAIPTVINKQF
jgi:hypothetical protein